MILESMVFLSCLNNIYQERPFRYDGVIVYKEDLGDDRRYTAILNRIMGNGFLLSFCRNAGMIRNTPVW